MEHFTKATLTKLQGRMRLCFCKATTNTINSEDKKKGLKGLRSTDWQETKRGNTFDMSCARS